ncbi:MAG TPA: methyltransferase [Flavobacteriales bacterium]|nr:methyltransferase [Flavobacteriales bacterium]
MEFLPEEISEYAERFTGAETETLSKLNVQTWQQMIQPRMLSGHLQGRVLSMLSKMIKPKHILEIGTFTGYSALCLAEGLLDGGKIITLDINEEFESIARKYFSDSGMEDRIDLRIGNALEIIPGLKQTFDLVFIDADKENYSNYFDLVIEKLATGGIIIADNVLWSGKVVQENPDVETKALMDYVEKIHRDERVENVLLPIRDGLMICRKI